MEKECICLFGGSLDSPNQGVVALSKSLVNLFSSVKDYRIVLFSPNSYRREPIKMLVKVENKTIEVECVSYYTLFHKPLGNSLFIIYLLAVLYRFIPFLRATIIRRNYFLNLICSAVIIGDIRGGDSFSDIYGIKRFFTNSLPLSVIRFLKKEYVLLPQKFGPFYGKGSQWLAKKNLIGAEEVFCRDKKSIEIVNDVTNGSIYNRVKLCPDVAFVLPITQPKRIEFEDNNLNILEQSPIGINISGLLWMGGYNESNMFGLKEDYRTLVKNLVKTISEISTKPILLIPHTVSPHGSDVENDYSASKELYNILQHEIDLVLLKGCYDASELKWIISKCSFFMGARMHACIAALSQGIPTIGHAYSDKFVGVFDSIGVESSVLDLRTIKKIELLTRTKEIYENSNIIFNELPSDIKKVKITINDTFSKFMDRIVHNRNL